MQHSDLVGYYQKSHAFVLFSRYETFSIVIAEAWSTGIPVISTPVGIASKMTDDQGLLVLNHDPLSLALEMEKILNGLTFHTQTIRDKAQQFSSENVLKQLNQLYERITK
jgi:glycosyltransferase involved in cell wall biosynthesis